MDYQIGISGLDFAQRAIDLIGTNIANASTEGYHRQELRAAPQEVQAGGKVSVGGVQIIETRRVIDRLLEQELIRQQEDLGQVDRELSLLQSVENALGTVDSEGLTTALSGFFNSLRELSAQPNSQALQEQAVWAADTLAGQFRSLGGFLDDLDKQIVLEARNVTDKVNDLSSEIAQLNDEIHNAEARGASANLLLDRRDQAISDLSGLLAVSVDKQEGESDVVTVSAWGTPLVMKSKACALEIGYDDAGRLGFSVKDAGFFLSDVSGGQLGGLLALSNEILPEIRGKLDALATGIIAKINQYHSSGIGSAGSFAELTGLPLGDPTAALSAWAQDVTDGTFHVRLVSPSGASALYSVSVDADTDTLNSIVAKLNLLDPAHFKAEIVDSALHMQGLAGYKFDFLPVPTTDTAGWTGPAPSVSGIFTGAANQTYTCTAEASGQVGVDDGLTVRVTDGTGAVVKVLSVGRGYPAGEALEVAGGISLAFGTGTLTAGKTFTVQALAEGDTSGFLPAAGMNTLFSGKDALSMAVRSDILAHPSRLAASLGAQMSDNTNVSRMAEVGDAPLDALDGLSPTEYYRRFVSRIGQDVLRHKAKAGSLEAVARQLMNQREGVSGVDVNEEAAKLLVFQRMFQAMSKFISAQNQALEALLQIM